MMNNPPLTSPHRSSFLEDFNQGVAAIEVLPDGLYSSKELLGELQSAMDPYLGAYWRISLLLDLAKPRSHFGRIDFLRMLRGLADSFEGELESCREAQEYVASIDERTI